MKKLRLLVLILFLSNSVVGLDLSQCQKKTFTITGYYSPKADQDRYYRGTYEKEKLLNGNGTHGASGKPVFNGMIAAPKTYSFGTKIYLEGIGLGEVNDRGGAIVGSGNRGYSTDRLDIWMGEGQEGLQRALALGKRTVVGYICKEIDSKLGFDYSKFSNLSSYIPKNTSTQTEKKASTQKTNLTKTQVNKTVESTLKTQTKASAAIFTQDFGKGYKGEDVKKLQNILTKLGYYKGKVTGIYDNNSITAVYNFQLDNGIIKKGDKTAGYFGQKTRETVEKKYNDFQALEEKKAMLKSFSGTFNKGDKSDEIKRLQNALSMLGFYKSKITGVFDKDTIEAVAQFQLKNFLIGKEETKNRGVLGKKTLQALNLALAQISANIDK